MRRSRARAAGGRGTVSSSWVARPHRARLVGCPDEGLVDRADAEPAVAVAVERDLVAPAVAGAAVLGADEVDEVLTTRVAHPEVHGLRGIAEVVERDHRGLAEAVGQHEHRFGVNVERLALA